MSVYAMDGLKVIAKVPFTFTVGEHSFPAGNYTFAVDNPDEPAVLTVKSDNGEKYDVTLTESRPLSEAARKSKVVFEKYGNQSYLSEVWVDGMDSVQIVPQMEIQKEVERNAEHETISIGAQKR
jgi:hypothetical protein